MSLYRLIISALGRKSSKKKLQSGSPRSNSVNQELLSLTPHDPMPLLAEHHRCESNEWQCANKRCIPEAWRCDSENDCGDNSDEDVYNCASRLCQPGYFKCANNHCIPQEWKCDVDNDCGDHSDEPLPECREFLRGWGGGIHEQEQETGEPVWRETGQGGPCFSPMAASLWALPANSGTTKQSIAMWSAGRTRPCSERGWFLLSIPWISNASEYDYENLHLCMSSTFPFEPQGNTVR